MTDFDYEYDEEETPDNKKRHVIKVSVNKEELTYFREAMLILDCPFLSTVIKDLAKLGYANVVRDEKTKQILKIALTNQRRNFQAGRHAESIIKANVDPLLLKM